RVVSLLTRDTRCIIVRTKVTAQGVWVRVTTVLVSHIEVQATGQQNCGGTTVLLIAIVGAKLVTRARMLNTAILLAVSIFQGEAELATVTEGSFVARRDVEGVTAIDTH